MIRPGRYLAVALMTAAIAGMAATASAGDSQIRPFVGTTFSGGTQFLDLEAAAPRPHRVYGIAFAWLGDMFGFDAEVADAPGFLESDDYAALHAGRHLVLSSRVTTVMGDFIIAAPRRYTEYVFRPYFVGGGGLMRLHSDDSLSAVPFDRVLPAFNLGGGAMAFFTDRVGFTGEVRRFQNFYHQTTENGVTLGNERLSFWRATMAFVYRY